MPRSTAKERLRVEAAVSEFLNQATRNNLGQVSISSVSRALHISRSTIRKYGLEKSILELRKASKKQRKKADERIALLQEEATLWRRRYEGLLELYTRLEYQLRQNGLIDIDALLAEPMLRPVRTAPSRPRSVKHTL